MTGTPVQSNGCPCVYCGQDSYNVMEVRYARTLSAASQVAGRIDDDDTPREIVGRGYYICDGCLALLDYHEEHHLDAGRHGFFNVLSGAYQLFLVWALVAIWALADGNFDRLKEPQFYGMGLVLALVSLSVWLLRASVHMRYLKHWKDHRTKPRFPRNTLNALTSLRDRVSPELGKYLPVRFEDSLRLAALPGSPPIRSIGPSGEPWGEGPAANFAGWGDNDWYRMVWISWRLWPLTNVTVPEGVDWDPPPPPTVSEIEVASAAFVGVGVTTFSVMTLGAHPVLSVGIGLVLGAAAFFGGIKGRQAWAHRKAERRTGSGG